MKYNQLSRYGSISKDLPFVTGKVFFLVNPSEAALPNFNEMFPADEDGVARVYTTWASVISACEASTESDLVVVSPLFSTAPTTAQINSLKAANAWTMQAGSLLPDGSYIATKAAVDLSSATTVTIFTSTGKVKLIQLFGEVATTLGAATTGLKFLVLPTTGSTTDLCATTDVKNLAAGAQVSITGTLANALVATTQGAVVAQAASVVIKAGNVQINTTGTTSGNVRFTAIYSPVEPGAFLNS